MKDNERFYIMRYRMTILFIGIILLVGCGNTEVEEPKNGHEISSEVQEDSKTIQQSDSLDYLLNNYTSIQVCYGYDTQKNTATGNTYFFSKKDDIASFTGYENEGYKEQRRSDFSGQKYEELRELLIESEPSLYKVAEHVDANGKIIYETLNPVIILHGSINDGEASDSYNLTVSDATEIESFMKNLMSVSDIEYSDKPSSSTDKPASNTDNSTNNTFERKQKIDSYTGYVVKTIIDGTRVRAEANTDSDIIARLPEGEYYIILDNTQDDEWIKIDLDGDEGYVSCEYVNVEYTTISDETSSTNSKVSVGDVLSIRSTTNMRSEKSPSSSKVDKVYTGDEVLVLETDDEWTLIQFNQKQGYIKTNLLGK